MSRTAVGDAQAAQDAPEASEAQPQSQSQSQSQPRPHSPHDTLTFVTGNAGKVRELQAVLEGTGIRVIQANLGYPEVQADSLAEVAEFGRTWLREHGAPVPFLLEDSGLFIPAVGGFPGVYSRYALDTLGPEGVLRAAGIGAAAEFHCHLLLATPEPVRFTGIVRGTLVAPRGDGGFGFDSIFQPVGENRTFAEMETAEKNALSHRGQAVRALAAHLGDEGKESAKR